MQPATYLGPYLGTWVSTWVTVTSCKYLSSSFPDKCLLEPQEGLIFSPLLRDTTENECVLLQREEESDVSQIAGTSHVAPPRMVVLATEA